MRQLALLAAFCLALASCGGEPDVLRLSGETMGTTYHITIVDPPADETAKTLGETVEAALAEVNVQMSNWDPDSEVSRFNAHSSTNPVEISDGLAEILETANAIHVLSGGKFDVTVAPLIEIWGFGPSKPGDPIPSDAAIDDALQNVGQGQLLDLEPGPMLVKRRPGVTVNLSAIAKGYGIDKVAAALRAAGAERYLVEIGGDLVAAGLNPDDEPWSIGIEKPDAAQKTIELIVPVTNMGLATSGDYRNFFELDGVRYSHIIDPTTGRPITHRTTSVTVIAKSAMLADGLATAMLAVGAETGIDVAEENNIAVMFISHDGAGFVTRTSSAFEKVIRGN